jgi:hypothetical protein
LLVASLGQSSVFTRPGERQLWVLGEDEALLWELHSLALNATDTATLLAQRFGLSPSQAQSMFDKHLRKWRSVGLLQDADAGKECPEVAPWEELIQFPPAVATDLKASDLLLSVAQRTIILRLGDEALHMRIAPLIAHLCVSGFGWDQVSAVDLIEHTGEASNWQLLVNGATMMDGQGQDEAVVSILKLLSDIGSRTAERLLVVHGAGLVSPTGQCFLMAATGGAGKTTLAVALEAEGYRLLSDDVVPIDREGAAVRLGLPACIKSGSWDVLQPYRPDLAAVVETSRFGQLVRYLPPRHPVASKHLPPRLLLFPSYRPDQESAFQWLSPEEALQRLVAAGAVIRDLTQKKLEDLSRWVSSMPAYAIQYPSLVSGTALVQTLLGRLG